MKKGLIVLLCAVMVCAGIAGCSTEQKLVGEWKYTDTYLRNIEPMFAEDDSEELQKSFSQIRLTINEDGTYVVDYGLTYDDANNSKIGTYVVKGETVIFTADSGEKEEYTFKNDKLWAPYPTTPMYDKVN